MPRRENANNSGGSKTNGNATPSRVDIAKRGGKTGPPVAKPPAPRK